MENWEVQEMKDNLAILEYEMEGTRECEVLKKARNYINDLEEMLIKVAEGKKMVNKPRAIEEVEEECPCMKEKSLNCGMKCSMCGREL